MATGNQARRDTRCIAKDCDLPRRAKGYCSGHYSRLREGRPVDDTPLYRLYGAGYPPETRCLVEGCQRTVYAHLLCQYHYGRKLLGKSLVPEPKPQTICSAEGCARPVRAKGYCGAHYSRLLCGRSINGTQIEHHSPPYRGATCSMQDCKKEVKANGLCAAHHSRQLRGQELTTPSRVREWSIADLRSLAAERGGRCLSTTYTSVSENYRWECAAGHRWEAAWHAVKKKGSWCPECSSGRAERVCRHILQQMLGVDLSKARPVWLRDPGKRRPLELDGFNSIAGIAFEYQGIQHYRPWGRYSEGVVAGIQTRDARKRKLCWDHGVRLIVVPVIKQATNITALINQIELAVLQAGLKIPRKWAVNRPTSLPELWKAKPSKEKVV